MKSVDKLVKRVTGMVDRHPPLGLQGWEFHIAIVDQVRGGGCASCSCSSHYRTAWLEFEREWLRDADENEIDKVIFHELLHVVFRDMDHLVESTAEHLASGHQQAFTEAYHHELEGVIERLSRTFDLALRDVVQ